MRKVIFIFLIFSLTGPVICCKEGGVDPLKIEEQEKKDQERKEQDERRERQANAIHNYANFPVRGGFHIPFIKGSTEASFGYYVYIPEDYVNSESEIYPLLVYLHGSGERGNSSDNPSELDKAIIHGPGKLIRAGNWSSNGRIIIVSAQTDGGSWRPEQLKEFLTYLQDVYRADINRVYLTGISMGAYGIYEYLGVYGESANIAAAIPICGGVPRGFTLNTGEFVNRLAKTPLWAFHGEADDAVSYRQSVDIVSAINTHNPRVPAKVTIFPHVGHDSWTMTYDGSGDGKESAYFAPFDQNVFDWLFQYSTP